MFRILVKPASSTGMTFIEIRWYLTPEVAVLAANALVDSRLDCCKSLFYCVNTSYPMDNSLSGRRGPARQTSEKDVLCLHRLGRPSAVHSPDGV